MKQGAICLMRRHQLFKKVKNLGPQGEPIALISLFLDQESLHQYANETKIVRQSPYKGPPMVNLSENVFLKGFFDSLVPYINQPQKLTDKVAALKTREAIELVLQAGDEFDGFLFDFQQPYKTDLAAYMNHNFQYNIPLLSFAKLTGRSLSTFKRDFTKLFETTPEKWLQTKRLEQAYYLLAQKHLRPSEVYLEVGFENLSHFSRAFSRRFGVTTSQLHTKSSQSM